MVPPPPFERLLAYRPFVRELARRLTSDETLADDLEQQAWVQALDRPPRHDRALRGWFSRVLRNAWVNSLVSERRRGDRERFAASLGDRRASEDGVDPELRRVLAHALDALPAVQAEVLRLRFFEGLDADEVARRLGVPSATVRTRQRRSLERLRERLDGRYGDRTLWASALGAWALAPRRLVSRGALVASVAGAFLALGGLGLWLVPDRAPGLAPLARLAPETLGASIDLSPTARAPSAADPLVPRAEATAPRAGLRLRAHWEDGSPAGGIGVRLEPRDGGAPHASIVAPTGVAAWEGLAPGAWEVLSTTGRRESVELAAGGWTVLDWELDVPHPLTVEVIQLEGFPSEGIEILVSPPGQLEPLIGSARTDATGTAVLPDFDPGSWILARQERSLSRLVSLDHPRLRNDPDPRIELVLDKTRRPLTVTVLDPDGEAVADARVCFGNRRRFPAHRRADGLLELPPRWEAITDADGAATVLGRAQVQLRLEVEHGAFAPWSGSVGDDASTLTVRLAPPACIEGTLRGIDGAPLAGALVRWLRGPSSCAALRTDADGRYRLPPCEPGAVEVEATWGEGDEALLARARLDLAAGARTSWSPELERAPVLRGRAVDAHGEPLAGCWVALLDPPPADPFAASAGDLAPVRWAAVDARGDFHFAEFGPAQASGERALRVFDERRLRAPLAWLDDVPFAAADLLLVAQPGRATGAVVVQAPRDPVLDLPEVLLTSPHAPLPLRGERRDGAWRFEQLGAGAWSVWAWGADAPPWHAATVEVAAGVTTRLELDAPPPPGRLEATLFDPSGAPARPRRVELVRLEPPALRMEAYLNRGREELRIEPGGRITARAPAGEYALVVHKADLVDASRRVTLESDRTTRLEIAMEAGPQLAFELEMPQARSERARELWFEFRTPEGELRLEDTWRIDNDLTRATLVVRVPEDELVLHARLLADGEVDASGEVRLPAVGERRTGTPVAVVLE